MNVKDVRFLILNINSELKYIHDIFIEHDTRYNIQITKIR